MIHTNATNLITGVADANMDRAPVVAISGQGATTRMHKESHHKVAQTEKPGAVFVDFPENIAEMAVESKPIKVQTASTSTTPDIRIEQAAKIISEAKYPVILAGNGVIRQGAADSLVSFADVLRHGHVRLLPA